MKLFYSPASPYVRKVSALIVETGLTGIEHIPAKGTPTAPDAGVLGHNPLGKIPALILDDGRTLFDSRVICQYLNQHAGTDFYPQARLWDTLTLEALADGILDAALLVGYETRLRPEALHFAPWVDGQWSKVERALDVLERDWTEYLTNNLDMGVLALGCALGYLDLRQAHRMWRNGRPALAAWEAEFAKRPAMQATIPQL